MPLAFPSLFVYPVSLSMCLPIFPLSSFSIPILSFFLTTFIDATVSLIRYCTALAFPSLFLRPVFLSVYLSVYLTLVFIFHFLRYCIPSSLCLLIRQLLIRRIYSIYLFYLPLYRSIYLAPCLHFPLPSILNSIFTSFTDTITSHVR